MMNFVGERLIFYGETISSVLLNVIMISSYMLQFVMELGGGGLVINGETLSSDLLNTILIIS